MKLFLPNARATNWLLIVGFCSLGYSLYIRYMAIEQSSVGLACAGGLDTWLCSSRAVIAILFKHSVFGFAALAVALINLLRPSLVVFAVALALTCLGIVLYNVALSSLAAGILVLSFARRAPAPE
jgi:membrane-associated HD superfamily phosphohydrolase